MHSPRIASITTRKVIPLQRQERWNTEHCRSTPDEHAAKQRHGLAILYRFTTAWANKRDAPLYIALNGISVKGAMRSRCQASHPDPAAATLPTCRPEGMTCLYKPILTTTDPPPKRTGYIAYLRTEAQEGNPPRRGAVQPSPHYGPPMNATARAVYNVPCAGD